MGNAPLVGRELPLRRLTRVLDEAMAGLGRLVLISGEPGVGKSRLALEVLDVGERRGALSVMGACWDGAGAPGLWPWVQALRAIRGALGEDQWHQATRSGHDALVRLLESDEQAPPAEFHLFESMLQFLVHVCEERPLVVLLDDLQWADSTSLSLVDFLYRHAVHLPLLIVGTYRTDEVDRPEHAHYAAIADLAQKAATVPLSGLDNDAVRELRESLGASTSTAEAEHLRRLTGGNPFFVIESVAYTDPTESLGVRRAIERRVNQLGEHARHVLTIASLIGREVPDELLVAVAGEQTEVALRQIEGAGLLRREQREHVFVHDLVRDTLRAGVSADERRALYARIVRAADDSASAVTLLLPAQLAWFATQAVPEIPAERAVALLVAAAADASARLTHEAAGRHLDDAAALSDDPLERAQLTLRSAHAYHRGGALAAARERYARLLNDAPTEIHAEALLGLHEIGDPAAAGNPSDVVRLLDAVDAELRRTPNVALRAQVLAARSRARSHLLAEDRTTSASMAAEALELARAVGDEVPTAACLLAYHDAIWQPGTEDQRRAIAVELAETGRSVGDPAVEAQGLLLRMVAELELGDRRALATHRQFDAVAEASRSPRWQYVAGSRRGMVATVRADLDAAVAEIDAARQLGERIGEPDARGVWCDQRWHVARQAGDHDTVAELLATLRGMEDPHWMVYEAMVAADRGDADHAERFAPEVAELGARWPRWAVRLWDVFNVELAIVRRDEALIAELVGRLEPDAAHWAVLGGGVLLYGPMSLWLGRLEAGRGRWDRALAWSNDAEAAARRMGVELWSLEARTDRLAAQAALGTLDGAEVASAVAAAHDRGLIPIVERLSALVPATPRSTNVFRREGDVWTLVFDGVDVRMPDTKGLRDLRTLLANPGIEVPAPSLVTDAFASGDAPAILDVRAKEAYRARLDDLDRELDRAALRGDASRAELLESERDALLDELRLAAGLAGRDRRIDSDRERLRKTVTARIHDTMRRLDDRHPALAVHLRASVRTGAVCVYAPSEPVGWDLGPSARP